MSRDMDDDSRKKKSAIQINVPSPKAALKYIREKTFAREGFAMATINLYHIVMLSRNKTYLEAYLRHDVVVADGFPIVWLGKIAGWKNIQKTTGSDLTVPLIRLVHETGGSLAMIGTTAAVLERASEAIRRQFPGIRIVFTKAPSFSFNPLGKEALSLMEEVRKRKVSLCLLAFGAPKQEILAAVGKHLAPHTGFVSVGASIDFIVGHQKRAPKWARKANLEWFWRLALSPKRLFKRYFLCALLLPILLLRAWAEKAARALFRPASRRR